MKSFLLSIFLLIGCLDNASVAMESLKPYQIGDWGSVVQSAEGQPVAIHFWGVTCAPCVKEMPQWGKFLKNNKNVKVIFIQVDDVPQDAIRKMLSKADLSQASNYYVSSSFDERLRYEVDSKWRGETPITILIDRNGGKMMNVGPINFARLRMWFSKSI